MEMESCVVSRKRRVMNMDTWIKAMDTWKGMTHMKNTKVSLNVASTTLD